MARLPTDRSLGPGEKPEARRKYAHMMREDHATWTEYLQSDWNDLERVWYDVHVGRAMLVPAGSPEYMQDVVDGVSRKRIDVVAQAGNAYIIIEVKPEANMEAIGQVVTYQQLFMREFQMSQIPEMRIIAMTCDADIDGIAQSYDIEVIALNGTTL